MAALPPPFLASIQRAEAWCSRRLKRSKDCCTSSSGVSCWACSRAAPESRGLPPAAEGEGGTTEGAAEGSPCWRAASFALTYLGVQQAYATITIHNVTHLAGSDGVTCGSHQTVAASVVQTQIYRFVITTAYLSSGYRGGLQVLEVVIVRRGLQLAHPALLREGLVGGGLCLRRDACRVIVNSA
jgi:hypothetical protein